MPRFLALVLVLLLVPSAACQQTPSPSPSPAGRTQAGPTRAAHGMVVAGQGDAARVGLAVLQDGGNAIDAAVATGFALAVTLPNAGNVGGGGFMLIRFPDGTATSLDFREIAPLAATATMYQDSTGAVVPGRSTEGHLASGVPGTVAGLLEAHAKWGSLPLDRLLDPAVDLAEAGFVLSERQANLFNGYRPEFSAHASTRRYFVKPDGADFEPGERFVQRDLAAVLRRIRDRGRDGFYRGETADLIVAEMERGGGSSPTPISKATSPSSGSPSTGRTGTTASSRWGRRPPAASP